MRACMSLIFRIAKYFLLLLLFLHVLFFIIILSLSFAFSRMNPPSSSLIQYRKLADHHEIKEMVFVPLDKIKPWISHLVILSEDKGFLGHHGIDMEAIRRAYSVNKSLGGYYLGGSTITQQLARSLFLWPSKNYFRKYLEIISSLSMELVMPKKRILELYLNYIELGKGVFGIGEASRVYFGKPLEHLSRDEVIRIITIMPSPLKYTPKTFHGSGVLEGRYKSLQEKSAAGTDLNHGQ
jgi:monofunctional glycosyltransferase